VEAIWSANLATGACSSRTNMQHLVYPNLLVDLRIGHPDHFNQANYMHIELFRGFGKSQLQFI
jgi:hypothetical protein